MKTNILKGYDFSRIEVHYSAMSGSSYFSYIIIRIIIRDTVSCEMQGDFKKEIWTTDQK